MLAKISRRGLGAGVVLFAALIVATLTVAGYGPLTRALSKLPESGQDYQGTALGGEAVADFRLVNQRGEPVALSEFRGKAVALAFLAPECTDVCPLTALHFRLASEALGDRAGKVVFLAVNANAERNSVTDVAVATEKWGMSTLQGWHYLTGPAQELERVWKAYRIFAGGRKPDKSDETLHSPGVYIIDQAGRERWYISIPLDNPDWIGPSLSELLQRHLRQLLEGK